MRRCVPTKCADTYRSLRLNEMIECYRLTMTATADRVEGAIVLFAGPGSVCSNLFPWECVLDGRSFQSNEHAYQWAKLRYLGLASEAEDVLNTTDVFAAMRLAKERVELAKDDPCRRERVARWKREEAENLLHHLASIKINRCPVAINFMKTNVKIGTGGRVMTEFWVCTRDEYWGIGARKNEFDGMNEQEIRTFASTRRGQNKFGKILKNAVQERAYFIESGACVLRPSWYFRSEWLDSDAGSSTSSQEERQQQGAIEARRGRSGSNE